MLARFEPRFNSASLKAWRGGTATGSDEEARIGTILSDHEKRWLVMRLRAFLKLDLRTNIFAEPEGQESCPPR